MHYYANIVISHLLDEGYAPNFESAEQIFGSMSDEWIEDILESDAAAAVAARAATLARQRRGQTPERKAIYKNLATQAGERANPSPSGRDLNNRTGMTADFRRSRRGQSDWNIEHDRPGGITKNPKKLRKQKALGEFGESYEIDEGLGGARNASDEKRAQARLDDINARSDVGLAAYRAGTSRWQKRIKADQAQQFLRSHPRRKSSAKNEEYDVYDVILAHLLDEGYAETVESAEEIMVNMGEDWMGSIMIDEGMTMKDFKKNRAKLQKKEARTDAKRRGHVDRTWAGTGTYSTNQARLRRSNMSDDTRRARQRVAIAPDATNDEYFSADVTKNPKKLRKQRAMGEIK